LTNTKSPMTVNQCINFYILLFMPIQ